MSFDLAILNISCHFYTSFVKKISGYTLKDINYS